MKHFREYTEDASKIATPYVKRTVEFFSNAGENAKDWYDAKKKEHERKKNPSLWDRFKAAIGDTGKIILAVATIIGAIATIFAVIRLIIKKVYCSNNKIASRSDATDTARNDKTYKTEEASENLKDSSVSDEVENTGKPVKEHAEDFDENDGASDEIRKEKGYIVL